MTSLPLQHLVRATLCALVLLALGGGARSPLRAQESVGANAISDALRDQSAGFADPKFAKPIMAAETTLVGVKRDGPACWITGAMLTLAQVVCLLMALLAFWRAGMGSGSFKGALVLLGVAIIVQLVPWIAGQLAPFRSNGAALLLSCFK